MGDKIKAKEMAQKIGLPLVPGSKGIICRCKDGKKEGKKLGFPILIKASAGGEMKGMKIVNVAND